MKTIKLILFLLSMLLIFTACSRSSNTTVKTEGLSTQVLEQQPDRIAEIYGQVKTILGNEITVALAEPPQDNSELSEAEKEKKRIEMQALSPEERQQKRNEQLKFTGETAVIIIPVGTPIFSGNTINGQQNFQELTLGDIYEGTFVRIWVEEGGAGEVETAEHVRVLQSQ